MGKQAWIIMAALGVLAGCAAMGPRRSSPPPPWWSPEQKEAWWEQQCRERENEFQQREGLREIAEGLNSIRWTTPGHYYLQAQRNKAPRKCDYCHGTGFVGPHHIGCFVCGQTGLED